MDPITAGQIAGTAFRVAQGAWTGGRELYDFYQDVKSLEETAGAFASEVEALGTACYLVSRRVKSIVKEHECEQRSAGESDILLPCLERQLADCHRTVTQLQDAISCINVEEVKSSSRLKQAIRQVQLNMKANDIEVARNRIRSYTSSLQLTLQTITLEVSFVIPNRVDAKLRPQLEEVAGLRQELESLRAWRTHLEESNWEQDEAHVLQASHKVISSGETLYNDSVAGGSIVGEPIAGKVTSIYEWIRDVNAIDSVASPVSTVETKSPSVFSAARDGRSSSYTEDTISTGRPANFDSTDLDETHFQEGAAELGSDDEFAIEAVQQATADGQSAFKKQDFTGASVLLQEALKMARELPTGRQTICDSYDIRFMLGVCAFHLDDASAAKEALLSIVDNSTRAKVQDDNRRQQVLDAGHLLAQTYTKLGQLELARSICDSTLQGRRRLSGKTHDSCLESLALKSRIMELQGYPSRAKIYAAMLPSDRRESLLHSFAQLEAPSETLSDVGKGKPAGGALRGTKLKPKILPKPAALSGNTIQLRHTAVHCELDRTKHIDETGAKVEVAGEQGSGSAQSRKTNSASTLPMLDDRKRSTGRSPMKAPATGEAPTHRASNEPNIDGAAQLLASSKQRSTSEQAIALRRTLKEAAVVKGIAASTEHSTDSVRHFNLISDGTYIPTDDVGNDDGDLVRQSETTRSTSSGLPSQNAETQPAIHPRSSLDWYLSTSPEMITGVTGQKLDDSADAKGPTPKRFVNEKIAELAQATGFVVPAAMDTATRAAIITYLDRDVDYTETMPKTNLCRALVENSNQLELASKKPAKAPMVARVGSALRTIRLQRSPLHLACLFGDSEVVEKLMAFGGKPKALCRSGLSTLHCAAIGGYCDIAELMIAAGCPVDSESPEWGTPFYCAVAGKRLDVVDLLLCKGASSRHSAPAGLGTVAHFACMTGDVGLVKAVCDDKELLKATAKKIAARMLRMDQVAIEPYRRVEETKIEATIGWGFRHDGAPAFLRLHCFTGASPLIVAVYMGCTDVVAYLINIGLDVNTGCIARHDHWGQSYLSPLAIACAAGFDLVVQLLLDNGAVLTTCEGSLSAPWDELMCASMGPSDSCVDIVLKHGARIHADALHIAIRFGKIGLMTMFLQFGITSEVAATALATAMTFDEFQPRRTEIQSPHLQPIKDCMTILATVRGAVNYKWKPHFASSATRQGEDSQGHQLIINRPQGFFPRFADGYLLHMIPIDEPFFATLLIEAGADVNARDSTSSTPLMIAANKGYAEVVKKLLEHHALRDTCNKQGWLAVDYARGAQHQYIVELLSR